MATFDLALNELLRQEGGYVNDPEDPGGETKFGISKRAYPDLDIAGLTLEDAKAIYRRDYWDKVRGDDLPVAAAVAMFDCAVNQGVKVAIVLAQRAAAVADDGVIGPQTVAGIGRLIGEVFLIRFMALRALRYTRHRKFERFGKGWMRRLFAVTGFALRCDAVIGS